MATSVVLHANRSAAVSADERDTNFSTGTEWVCPPLATIYWGFEPLPSEYIYRKLDGFGVSVYAKKTSTDYPTLSAWFHPISSEWNESEVTYNNRPSISGTLPTSMSDATLNYGSIYSHTGWGEYSEETILADTKRVLTYGIATISRPFLAASVWASSRNQEHLASISVTLSDNDVPPSSTQSPTSGYIDKAAANTFTATFIPSTLSFAALERVTLLIDWKESEDGTVTTIDCGNVDTYTFPANTFSGDTVIWRARMECSNGTTYNWPWRTLTTIEPLMTAAPTAPVNEVANGGQPILFRWTTVSSAGILPTGADLQYSENGTTWTTFGHVDGSTTEFSAAAGTLPPGTVYWRVRAINGSGAAGSWSDAAIFVNVSAPPQPSLSVNPVPFAVLSWQATGQQAYRIYVDGHDYGIRFGTEKTFTVPTPLADGAHTAQVTVQGVYGLWSVPAVQEFTVANIPGGEITLEAAFGVDAALSWTVSPLAATPSPTSDWARGGLAAATGANQSNGRRLRTKATTGVPLTVRGIRAADGYEFVLYGYDGSGNYLGQWTGEGFEKAAQSWRTYEFLDPIYEAGASAIRILARRTDNADITIEESVNIRYLIAATSEPASYQIFRDGVQIGQTAGLSFLDRTALGSHEWSVVGLLADGYYTRSNTVSGTLTVKMSQISLLSGGDWLELRLSENSPTQQGFSYQRTISLRHISGAAYPVLESSAFEDERGDYDVAFLTAEDAEKLLAMKGQVVILKSRGNRVIVGPLAQIEWLHSDMYISCRFSIQRIHWEDFDAQS